MKIKVLICDDQAILADGIRSVLSSCEDLEVAGIAQDGFEALSLVEKHRPDVVLMDIRMPNINGVIATQEIKRRYPEVKVLILTTFDDSDYILNAINYGASGYLLKDTSSSALIDAIKNAYAGDTILPAKIAKRIADAAKLVSNDREIKIKRAFPSPIAKRRSRSCSTKGLRTSRLPPRSNFRTARRGIISLPSTRR